MDDMQVADPMALFREWFAAASAGEPMAEAMTVATADAEGRPSARVLLLKALDERGFVFYTNLRSRKAQQLAANPHAAVCFHWKSVGRQVRAEGIVELVTGPEADAYFATRPRGSQLGAWASRQSEPLVERAHLERRIAELSERFGEAPIPRPEFWSGYRLVPSRIEFWREGEYRLHDRIIYTREADGWVSARLFP